VDVFSALYSKNNHDFTEANRTVTATLQEQARALGDPTRHDIFRYVADADAPVDIAELTEYFGLNHNAIRQHLAKLVRADLLVEAHASSEGRGRPRLLYRLNPRAESRWGVTGPYERVSVLLAEILRTGDTAIEVGRRSVRPQRLGAHAVADPVAVVTNAMERQGFDPAVRRKGGRIEMVLRSCPFAAAAQTDPDTVCAIHLGIAQGLAALTGERVVVDELVPHDPRRANCRLRMHLESSGDE
jgi:predicted ArsR family transcriptional regulator